MKADEAIRTALMAYDCTPYEDDIPTDGVETLLASLRANGFVVVPIEPTAEMVAAFSANPSLQLAAKGIWESMLTKAGTIDG